MSFIFKHPVFLLTFWIHDLPNNYQMEGFQQQRRGDQGSVSGQQGLAAGGGKWGRNGQTAGSALRVKTRRWSLQGRKQKTSKSSKSRKSNKSS